MVKSIRFFIVSCFFLILVACSNDNEASNEPTETEDGRVVLTGLITKHPLTKELENMEWLAEVEEKAGVQIKWEEVSADWDQKKGAMLASGEIPDIIIGPNAITDADFAQFPGLFENLQPLIEEHGPNIQAMFDEQPITKDLSTQTNGEIYGLSKYQQFWPETATMQFINKQWLDNLGLDVPKNWDELFDVLMAFKEEDANGNGDPNDEIPMDFAPIGEGGFGYFHPTVLLGSTGMTITGGGGQGYILEDGQVKNFFVDERYKEFVSFLHKLYANGLINEEAFTQDYSQYQALARGEGDTAKIGFTFGWESTDRFGLNVSDQYVTFDPMKVSADSDSDVSWSYDYNELNYGVNFIQMSSQTGNKEAAMKFINELYDPEVSLQILFGSIGPNIEKTGDQSYKILPPQDEEMDPGTWKWTSTWADNGPMFISDELEVELPVDMQAVDEQQEPFNKAFENLDRENDVFPGMLLKYSQEDHNAMTLVNTDFMNIAISKFGEWITTGGIEEQWEGYKQQVEQMGLQSNIDIIQKYYDEYKGQ
ncbi:putative aldouronate transport system substrate-binding protein [Gracilibacillus halotolerans]|uniref:Putative aldouronate transport system substrate-binding protein n=1 Tax=Gracilibacillus halotolerans TaxID=74386 RepID=A0A841RMF7_9BACI|nr:extracellular solute-binding protein [Gracilibacillus halotolerans]MBB6513679.1 putative aldouronate transport system substrate-binding protein [Gracilibacillus halotolerans]